MNRRQILRLMAVSSVFGCRRAGHAAVDNSRDRKTREFDVRGYNKVLLPREHGALLEFDRPMFGRYPSRDHCMQMVALFRPDAGLLIYSKDSYGSISDWELQPEGKLRIHFYGPEPEVVAVQIAPTIEAAAYEYRKWAVQQPWVTKRKREKSLINLFSVASNPNIPAQWAYLTRFLKLVRPPTGALLSQWRRFPFDSMYPDYSAKDPQGFASLLKELRDAGCTPFPYVNGMLWDARLSAFHPLGERVGLRDGQQALVPYNKTLSYLHHACPFAVEWQRLIADVRYGIRDRAGVISRGMYLDMLLAAQPYFCWSTGHGHAPGDATAWQSGVRSLLASIDGCIMTEGNAEIYIDLVDYVLMHLYTGTVESVPLWRHVYGDVVTPVGWTLPKVITAETLTREINRSSEFGLTALGTPWMTPTPEQYLISKEIEAVIRRQAGE